MLTLIGIFALALVLQVGGVALVRALIKLRNNGNGTT